MGEPIRGPEPVEWVDMLAVEAKLGRAPAWPALLAQGAEDLHVLAEEVQLIRQALEKIAMVLAHPERDVD